jgi:hypothetical protein
VRAQASDDAGYHLSRYLCGQARLSDTAGSGERHQPHRRVGQHRPDIRDSVLPADERGGRHQYLPEHRDRFRARPPCSGEEPGALGTG